MTALIVKRQLRQYERLKLERGEWLGTYPIGYSYIKSPREKYSKPAEVFIDPVKSLIVKDIFETYAQGKMSLKTLTAHINLKYASHHKLVTSRVHTLLMNKFYIGIMTYKGHEYPHNYPTFIDKELFDHVQTVMQYNTRHIRYGEKFTSRILHKKSKTEEQTDQITPKDIQTTILQICTVPHSLEQLSALTHYSLQELQLILLDLELDNKIRDNGSGYWLSF